MTAALITLSPLAIVQQWSTAPSSILVPGIGHVEGAAVGWTSGNYALASVTIVGAPISQFSQLSTTTLSYAAPDLTITNVYVEAVPTKPQLLTYARQKKNVKLQSGTALGGNAIPTDVQTQIILLAAYVQATANAGFTMQWNASGTPVTLNATQIKAAMAQVGTFFGSIQQIEATTIAGINAGTITTPAQIDTAFA